MKEGQKPKTRQTRTIVMIEVFVGLVILGLLVWWGFHQIPGFYRAEYERATRMGLKTLRQAVRLYRAKHNDRPPPHLHSLFTETYEVGGTIRPYVHQVPPNLVHAYDPNGVSLLPTAHSSTVFDGHGGWAYIRSEMVLLNCDGDDLSGVPYRRW